MAALSPAVPFRGTYPYTDTNPVTRFPVSLCQTASINGGCLASPSASVEFAAAVNSTNTFRVFVYAPTVNPRLRS